MSVGDLGDAAVVSRAWREHLRRAWGHEHRVRERDDVLYPQSHGPDGRDRLEAAWARPSWWVFREVNNTSVGLLYVATGLLFFLAAGVLALLMRIQLAWPGMTFLDPAAYNQVFTMHGTVMMFLFAVPIVEAVAVLLLPAMVGTRDMPFPWLSAFGYWCYAIGGTMVFSSLFFGVAPDGGWFMYPPLTSRVHSPGINADVWILGLAFIEIAAVAAAVELIVGILKTRAPGMTLAKMPIFAWYMLVTAGMIMLGMPAVIAADILLELERAFDMPFYDPTRGGDPLLWQHLFWLFGHPEVYIIFLPAAGLVSQILPTFARAPLVGYTWVVMAAVAIGFISFGLWVHHMYATGLPRLSLSFFAAASVAIAVPMGVQIFAWIATLWDGRPVLRVPLLYILGFLVIFTVGGLTGVMVAAVPYDWQAHDTYFIVAHLHYVLIGGMVFPLFAALFYYVPMISGRMYSERVGRWSFWLMAIGFNGAFLPMHWTGLRGMPRRVYTYPEELGVSLLNLASTVFAFIFAVGVLLAFFELIRAWVRGLPAGTNPFDAPSLEWLSANSQMGFRSLPIIDSRYPLWDRPQLREFMETGQGYLPDAPTVQRESLATGPVTGEPLQIVRLPGPSVIPFLAAAAIAIGLAAFTVRQPLSGAIALAIGAMLIGVWLWRREPRLPEGLADAGAGLALPLHRNDATSLGWWGMAVALIALVAVTASFVFAYLFLWTVQPGTWPPPGETAPSLAAVLPGLGSALAGWLLFETAERTLRGDRRVLTAGVLLLSAGAGSLALALGWLELVATGLDPTASSHAASVYALLGWAGLHVGIGVVMALWCIARIVTGRMNKRFCLQLRTSLLWMRVTAATVALLVLLVTGFPDAIG